MRRVYKKTCMVQNTTNSITIITTHLKEITIRLTTMANPQIEANLSRGGNAWVFRIPKALVDTHVLVEGKKYRIVVEEMEESNPLYLIRTDNQYEPAWA